MFKFISFIFKSLLLSFVLLVVAAVSLNSIMDDRGETYMQERQEMQQRRHQALNPQEDTPQTARIKAEMEATIALEQKTLEAARALTRKTLERDQRIAKMEADSKAEEAAARATKAAARAAVEQAALEADRLLDEHNERERLKMVAKMGPKELKEYQRKRKIIAQWTRESQRREAYERYMARKNSPEGKAHARRVQRYNEQIYQ